MQQQDVIINQLATGQLTIRQLAQIATDFLEPIIPYLVIGSRKADIEAGKKVGLETWVIKKKLWEKLCSVTSPELKEAAGDMVIAPSDPQVKWVLVQKVMKLFEKNPALAKEISSILEDGTVHRVTAKDASVRTEAQNSGDRTRVFEEFNELLEKFTTKISTVTITQNLKQPETEQEKEELMEKTLDFACQIQYGDLRSRALSLIVPYLEGPKKGEYIKKALYFTSNIQDEAERAAVLSSLVPHLKGPGKEELIENILDFAPHIQYGDAKFQIFSSLIPHMDEPINKELIEKALEMIFGIQSEYLRIQALSLLAPRLHGQGKEETIKEALQLASDLKDKDMRPEALSFIIPYLDEARKKGIIEKALEMASGIKSEYRRSQALSSLVPYLNEAEKEEIMKKIP
ncbi:MAG: hypothetical protein AB9861_05390 [Methanosarcina sp.]|jgi:hypothetical protein